MNTYTGRVDAHGMLFWLPAMPSIPASNKIKAHIEGLMSKAKNSDEALELLNMRGFGLMLCVNHHGPQKFDEWMVFAREKTYAAKLVAEAA